MWYVVILALFIGFVGGWAFFKHRQNIKDFAEAEAKSLRNSVANAIKPEK